VAGVLSSSSRYAGPLPSFVTQLPPIDGAILRRGHASEITGSGKRYSQRGIRTGAPAGSVAQRGLACNVFPWCFPSAFPATDCNKKYLILLAGVEGLEPPTPGFGVRLGR
jgi:hypothetical protein